jgi:serine/threonine-protein kinase RsbW
VSTAAQTATRYTGTFHGRLDQVRPARQAIAAHLADCPERDEAVLIASEMIANAVLHSHSGRQGFLTLRCERRPSGAYIEVEDEGGPWRDRKPDGRPHGLDIIQALTGPGHWGMTTTSDGTRITWARLERTAAP